MLQPEVLAIHKTFASSLICKSSKTSLLPKQTPANLCTQRFVEMDFLIHSESQVSFTPFSVSAITI